MTPETFSDNLGKITEMEKNLVAALKAMLGIYAKVRLVAPKSITRSEGKAVRVIDKRIVLSAPLIQQAIAQAEAVLQGNGRMLVRPSGTEPLVRVMAEAADTDTCRRCIAIVTDAIDACGFRA